MTNWDRMIDQPDREPGDYADEESEPEPSDPRQEFIRDILPVGLTEREYLYLAMESLDQGGVSLSDQRRIRNWLGLP